MEDLIHILWTVYLTIKQNMTFMNEKKKFEISWSLPLATDLYSAFSVFVKKVPGKSLIKRKDKI